MISSDRPLLDPVTRCPFCGVSYDEERLRTLKKEGRREVLHATCLQCSRAMYYTIERSEQNISCFGLFTDCDAQDALRFMSRKRISLDDVLSVHVALNNMQKS